MRRGRKSSFLYQEIKAYLLKRIRILDEMAALPSQTELSHRFQVNHLTVRRALQELEDEGLLRRIQGKGAFVRKPAAAWPLSIAVIIPGTWRVDLDLGGLVEGMLDHIGGRNIHLSLFPYCQPADEPFRAPKPDSFRAVIGVNTDRQMYQYIKRAFHRAVPILIINRIIEDPGISYVSTDHALGAREAVVRLLDKGHRRIGFVAARDEGYVSQRYEGYRAALLKRGLAIPEAATVNCAKNRIGDELVASVTERTVRMLETYRPTAVFVTGRGFIATVLEAARRTGRSIPDDLEVATYDEVADECPEKESIHEIIQPYREMGRVALGEMEKILLGQLRISRLVLPPTCVMKTTVRKKNRELIPA